MMPDPLAERVLNLRMNDGTNVAITVSLGRPHLVPGSDIGTWQCDVSIDDPAIRDSGPKAIFGEDSLQALVLATRLLIAHLDGLKLRYGARITFEGQENLCLGLRLNKDSVYDPDDD
jgi:hypothetical protein